jgi:MFS transporter, MHS family, proline/betaine transporter
LGRQKFYKEVILMLSRTKTLLASIVGTALEFYDFMLYAVFLETIGKEYFPGNDHETNQIFGYVGFLAAFIMRPFGASVFGYIGDRWGRRKALILSISLMGIPTCLIGILPSYAYWGVFSSVILIGCRLLQGLCTGGEYNGSAIFALEHVGKRFPGFVGGLVTGASVIGAFMATSVGILCTQSWVPEWGWRAAFCFGGVVSLVGLYIRLYTKESPEFQKMKKTKSPQKAPLVKAITRDWPSSVTTIVIGTLNGVLSYTLFKFLDIYLSEFLNLGTAKTLEYTLIGVLTYIFVAPFMGFILDKIGSKRMMLIACAFVFSAALPLYYLLQTGGVMFLVVAQILLAFMVGSIAGPQHAFVQTLFPVEDRYSGVSFNYSVGMAIGGGTGPILMKAITLQMGNLYAPAFVLMTVASLCFGALVFRIKKNKFY